MKKEEFGKMAIFFVISFAISQFLVYLLSKNNFFKSPLYVLLPAVAFFGLYLLMPYVIEQTKFEKTIIAIVFLVVCLLAFYIALYLFFVASQIQLGQEAAKFDFLKILFDSAFLEFIVGGLFGILAR
ncbi:MAG: hypothetical protein V1824_01555 [archaeon]